MKSDIEEFRMTFVGKRRDWGFSDSNANNMDWLSVEQLRNLIRSQVDRSFDHSGPVITR